MVSTERRGGSKERETHLIAMRKRERENNKEEGGKRGYRKREGRRGGTTAA